MDATTVDALVADYLRRLEAAATALPPDRRAELVAEIGGHIAEARRSGSGDEAAVRTVLDRLGEPEEIVAAAAEDAADAPPGTPGQPYPPAYDATPGQPHPPAYGATPAARPGPWGGLEIAAVALLAGGWLVAPVLGPVAGLVCAWVSTSWTTREKAVATLVAACGAVLPVLAIVGAGLVPMFGGL